MLGRIGGGEKYYLSPEGASFARFRERVGLFWGELEAVENIICSLRAPPLRGSGRGWASFGENWRR